MSWDRIQRQEAILLEKIAVLVQRLNDPRMGFVTITGVKLSRDRRHARIDYTVLGDESQVRTTMRALEDAAPHLQELLAPTLRMRAMPELRFHHDAGVEKQNRLLGLIEEITEQRVAEYGPDGELDAEGQAGEDGEADAESEEDPGTDAELDTDAEVRPVALDDETGCGTSDEPRDPSTPTAAPPSAGADVPPQGDSPTTRRPERGDAEPSSADPDTAAPDP